MRRMRNWSVQFLSFGFALVLSTTAAAQDPSIEFAIPPQALSSALDAVAKQADIQLLYPQEAVQGKQSDGVVGTFTVREAVEKVLQGTGLTYLFTSDNTVAVKAGEAVLQGVDPSTQQELRAEPMEIGTVTTTATRTQQSLRVSPASVSVVSKEDMKERNVVTVDQAVNTQAGVFSRRSEAMTDTLAAINLRGFPDPKRTLILLDGIPLNRPYAGTVNYGALPLSSIERIEVVKGPFSSLYGGYAMGGVVNVITREPEKRHIDLATGYGSSFDRGTASDNLRTLSVSYGDRLWNRVGLFAAFEHKATEGYADEFNIQAAQPPPTISGAVRTTDNLGATRYWIGDKGDKRWVDNELTLKTSYDFSATSKLKLSLLSGQFQKYADAPHTLLRDAGGNPVFSYTTVPPPAPATTVRESTYIANNEESEQDLYSLDYQTKISVVDIKFVASQVKEDRLTILPATLSTLNGGPGTLTESPSRASLFDLQTTFPLGTRNLIIVGGSLRRGRASSTNFSLSDRMNLVSKTAVTNDGGGKDQTYAVFVQDEISILANLTAYLGFRQDWWMTSDGFSKANAASPLLAFDKRNDTSFSPKLALVYEPTSTTVIRSSIGKAFRAPTVFELYGILIAGGVTFSPNPDLKPENTRSWEVGVDQEMWRGSLLKVVYFDNQMTDLIYRKDLSTTQRLNINVGKAEDKGVELEFKQQMGPHFHGFANATFNKTEIKENSARPETVGKQFIDSPERMYNLGGTVTSGPATASMSGRYASKRFRNDDNSDRVDGVHGAREPYLVADAQVSYRLSTNLTASVAVDNVFNRDYFDLYHMSGRSWFSKVTMSY